MSEAASKEKVLDGTRTRNLPLRRRMPYPLGHEDTTTALTHNTHKITTHATTIHTLHYTTQHAHPQTTHTTQTTQTTQTTPTTPTTQTPSPKQYHGTTHKNTHSQLSGRQNKAANHTSARIPTDHRCGQANRFNNQNDKGQRTKTQILKATLQHTSTLTINLFTQIQSETTSTNANRSMTTMDAECRINHPKAQAIQTLYGTNALNARDPGIGSSAKHRFLPCLL